jgi:adenylate kinase family enzyme
LTAGARLTGQRIAVIGSGGSGKSTFARALGARLGLPVIHLDTLFWRPGWKEMPEAEWRAVQEELVAADAWILDGNHESTLDVRLRRADTVVMLDFPRWRCLWRVVRRWYHFRNRARPDRAAGCGERLDRAFLSWVWSYPRTSRGRALDLVRRNAPRARFVRLRHPRDVRRLLRATEGPATTLD